jgi:hypothetical protein
MTKMAMHVINPGYIRNEYTASGKITTGIPTIDDMLHGGLPIDEGSVTIVRGEHRIGKTSLAMQLAKGFTTGGQYVLYFGFDETQSETGIFGLTKKIYLSDAYLINGRDPETPTPQIISRCITCFNDLNYDADNSTYRLLLLDANRHRMNGEDIANYVTDFVNRYGIKPVVIVDNVQAMRTISPKSTPANFSMFRTLSLIRGIHLVLISNMTDSNTDSDAFPMSYLYYIADTVLTLTYDRNSKGGPIRITSDGYRPVKVSCIKAVENYLRKTATLRFYPRAGILDDGRLPAGEDTETLTRYKRQQERNQ